MVQCSLGSVALAVADTDNDVFNINALETF